jgi:hypothetical protein
MEHSSRMDTKVWLLLAVMILAIAVLAIPTHSVFAANPPGTGQPNQSCEDVGVTPGHAVSAPGAAFNPDGVAPSQYAGSQPQNSNNPKSVSQYDVACFQVAQH